MTEAGLEIRFLNVTLYTMWRDYKMARGSILEKNSGNGGYLLPVERVTAAKTLDAVKDSGKIFLLDAADGAYSIDLPTTLEVGTQYKLIVEENTPTGAITIAAGSAIMFGKMQNLKLIQLKTIQVQLVLQEFQMLFLE